MTCVLHNRRCPSHAARSLTWVSNRRSTSSALSGCAVTPLVPTCPSPGRPPAASGGLLEPPLPVAFLVDLPPAVEEEEEEAEEDFFVVAPPVAFLRWLSSCAILDRRRTSFDRTTDAGGLLLGVVGRYGWRGKGEREAKERGGRALVACTHRWNYSCTHSSGAHVILRSLHNPCQFNTKCYECESTKDRNRKTIMSAYV